VKTEKCKGYKRKKEKRRRRNIKEEDYSRLNL
jgi:hypothetical protein